MSEICADKVQCGTLEQSVSPCGAGYVGSVKCEQPTQLPVTGANGIVPAIILTLLVLTVYGLYRTFKSAFRCEVCGSKLDYDYRGYDAKYGYCHTCEEYR